MFFVPLEMSSDTAKVNIGTAANDTQTMYSFNFNLDPTSLHIPVYLTDVLLMNATVSLKLNLLMLLMWQIIFII